MSFIAFVFLLISNFFLLIVHFFGSSDSSAYFDYNKVYNNCSLKKRLESDLEKVVSTRKSNLDSLQLELSLMSGKIEAKKASEAELIEFEDLKTRFLTLQNNFEQENIRLKENYTGQIRKEINEKAKLFSEKEGFDYLFSANGDGSLMFGAKNKDVTEDFQEFLDK